MSPIDFIKSRYPSLLGIIGPIIALVTTLISIAMSPWFSFRYDALSDLGVSDIGLLFNSGLVICGVFGSIFAIGFFAISEKRMKKTVTNGGRAHDRAIVAEIRATSSTKNILQLGLIFVMVMT